MAQLTQDLINLTATALTAPLTKLQLESVEQLALDIYQSQDSNLELINLKQIQFHLLVAQRVNQYKEGV